MVWIFECGEKYDIPFWLSGDKKRRLEKVLNLRCMVECWYNSIEIDKITCFYQTKLYFVRVRFCEIIIFLNKLHRCSDQLFKNYKNRSSSSDNFFPHKIMSFYLILMLAPSFCRSVVKVFDENTNISMSYLARLLSQTHYFYERLVLKKQIFLSTISIENYEFYAVNKQSRWLKFFFRNRKYKSVKE